MSAATIRPTRRQVLVTLGRLSGLVLAAPLGGSLLSGCASTAGAGGEQPFLWEPHLFLSIDDTGAVTIVAHRSEMGTGIRTSLPMALADELGADWSRVTVRQGLGDRRYGSQNTDGSRSVRDFLMPLRRVGATARTLLERAAAAYWDVDARECHADAHEVAHTASGRRLPFAALVTAAAALPVPAESEIVLRPASAWRHMGPGVPSVDTRGLLDGSAGFGLDVRLPGMLFAVIARCPVQGGRVARVDQAAALAVPGVHAVIEVPAPAQGSAPGFAPLGGVAVLASDSWSAIQGRAALEIDWDTGSNASFESGSYMAGLVAAAEAPGRVVRQRGDVDAALASAARVIQATYETPFLAHATLEPPCATARVSADGCECWTPTQNPQAAQGQVAATLGLRPEQVTVHVTLLGGGFGRKSKPDVVAEAAFLARAAGLPVQVLWTREDDLRHDYYHAAAAVHLRAGLDAEGRPTAWLQRSAFPSISSTFQPGVRQGSAGELGLGFSDVPFGVPNLRVENGEASAPLRIGWLRSVCNVFHAFALHSFADELAAARGVDPLAQLLELLGPPARLDPGAEGADYENYGESLAEHPIDTGRMAAVLRRAAEGAGWGRALPRGRGLGLAVHRSFAAFVAVCAEVEVAPDGRLAIPRVDIALDCGLVLDEDRVRSQMEGSVIFGVSLALHGAITARDGAVEQGNFHEYKLLRLAESPPRIVVHLLASDAPPGGVGEPGVPPVAPAICNALFAATGKRIRRLPLSEHDLGWS